MSSMDHFVTQNAAAKSGAAELDAAGFESADEIGRGGFGVVYRCWEPSLDRSVAVKILTTDHDEATRARFHREQRAAGRLTGHPNIVAVLHAGITGNGRPFIVMPYYAQGSLDRRLRDHAALPADEVLRIGVRLAGALESAHRVGVLHRDVKPGNILFTDYDEPALSDFGIAHFAGGFETEAGLVTGSPSFIALELALGGPPSRAADVYGLGATIFAAITGHVAFERRSGEQLMAQFLRITSEPVPDLREYGIAEDIGRIIEVAMSSDVAARPSMESLGQQLREAQRRHRWPVTGMPVPTPLPNEGTLPPTAIETSSSSEPLASERPVIAPVYASAGGLPLELTSFVDRRTELAKIKGLLSTARLVTLTGIGGVGKTRLAIRVAAAMERGFSGGVRLVQLGELHDESLLPSVLARSLGIRDRSMRPEREILAEFLVGREILLVLDNCEQVVTAVADIAEFLLRSCAELEILATSREQLGIGGEAVLLVPPLPVPNPEGPARGVIGSDAVKLFVDRAIAADSGFALGDDNREDIARICEKLDGLPLPIELAAARLSMMSTEQILERLSERFSLLTRGSRTAPSRQQTLRMCIDWSYNLCNDTEQVVWKQLSLFSGGFTLDAAEQVCDAIPGPTALFDVVGSLVEKSILIREKSGSAVRFRMLDTLREYGQHKARETDEFTRFQRRHRDWCEGLAVAAEQEWIGPRQIEWIETIAREQSNLREASEFCIHESAEVGARMASALLSFWISQGGITEGRRWLSRFADILEGSPTVEQAKSIHAGALGAVLQGDFSAATNLVESGLVLAGNSADPLVRAHLDHAVGDFALFGGDFQTARTHLGRAVDAFSERGLLHLEIIASFTLGLTFYLMNDSERAIRCYEQILAVTEERGETMYQSYSLWALAFAVWRRGDRERAIQLLERALRLLRRVNDRLNISLCLQALAWIAAEGGISRRAALLLGASESISRSVGSASVVLPGFLTLQSICEQESRDSLGEKRFQDEHRKGAAFQFQDAVDYALGEQDGRQRGTVVESAPRLTKREREVAQLIVEGLTNKQIAARLVISPRTAQGHVEHILTKLGFTSRTQIVTWVLRSI